MKRIITIVAILLTLLVASLLITRYLSLRASANISTIDTDNCNNSSILKWQTGSVVSPKEIENAGGLDSCFKAFPIPDSVFTFMHKTSWPEYCTLKRSDLCYIKCLHINEEGNSQVGELVVSANVANDILYIFRQLYDNRYKITKMFLIDNYGSDEASMAANNTSAFYYRHVTGSTTKLSAHSFGTAVDINPLYNPYVKVKEDKTIIEPIEGAPYSRLTPLPKNMPVKAIDANDLCCRLFKAKGFEWGGDYKSLKDYQHFELRKK